LHCPTNYNIGWALEFRYDGARARYLNRELNAQVLQQTGQFVSLGDTWTDYDGDSAYGDFTVNGSTVTNMKSYEPGMAQVDPWMSSGGTATDYVMSDHLGTTRGLIAPNNVPTDAAVYTAFGERISGTNHRFGYVGSWGYQSNPIPGTPNPDTAFPFLHVGARYYDPATGRFLQRDPIGIRGGTNVYAYVQNNPMFGVDPSGLWWWESDSSVSEWLACNFWMNVHSTETLANMSDTRATAEAVGVSIVVGGTIYVGGRVIVGQILKVRPYAVGPEPVTGPEVPLPVWPKNPLPPVKPSPPIEPGPPYYDPNRFKDWPTG